MTTAKATPVSPPAKERAGTPLSVHHVNLHFIDRVAGDTQHGSVDLDQRFYQIGGQFSDFHYRKRDWITMPAQIWAQLTGRWKDQLDYIEWYDRESDQAWLIDFGEALANQHRYDAGIGPRIGFPLALFVCVRERL